MPLNAGGVVLVPYWFWLICVFAFGGCIGSFLNVVIYRLPREKSLVLPPSACPSCGKRIQFFDNVPMLSWLFLFGRCRYCNAPISFRYFFIEFLTASIFTGLFYVYFYTPMVAGVDSFVDGGWFVYLVHVFLLACLVAASGIDMELWVIPISICWLGTALGFFASTVGVYIIDIAEIQGHFIFPSASAKTAAMAAGAGIGTIIAILLLKAGILKQSYDMPEQNFNPEKIPGKSDQQDQTNESNFNDREEIFKEIFFLLPIFICSIGFYKLAFQVESFNTFWVRFSQQPAIAGFLGSLWGYFIGCGVVWIVRILGTLGFGKEAMGLGDVHLMGAAGAVIGPVLVVFAFFIAPFFGLAWALFQMFFKKTRQIPYGPFLSMAVFAVMILHDWVYGAIFDFYFG